jgi:isoquinoline 1-oxidoreductase beta subunit
MVEQSPSDLGQDKASKIKRRSFLIKTGWVAAGLTVVVSSSCSVMPPTPTRSDNPHIDAFYWIQVTPDNQIRFFMGKAEMGQGILSGLSQIIAAEMRLPLLSVRPSFAHTNQIPPIRFTVGSDTTSSLYPAIRLVCTHIKRSLKLKFVEQYGGAVEELREVEGGFTSGNDPQVVSWGEMAGDDHQIEPIDEPLELASVSELPLLGKRQLHLDARVKVRGEAQYTHDVDLEGMLFGKVAKPPSLGAELRSVDSSDLDELKGVLLVVTNKKENFVGVIAETYQIAQQAVNRLKIDWRVDKNWQQSDIDTLLDINTLKRKKIGFDEVRSEGDLNQGILTAAHTVELNFSTPFAAHATMETQAAVADVRDDGADLWVGSQDSFLQQKFVEKITGLPKKKINVHQTFIGGGFGGKVVVGAAIEATYLSNAIKRPVKVIWSREENLRNSYYRPPSKHRITAGVGEHGKVSFWHHEFSSGAVAFTTIAFSKFMHRIITTFATDFGATRGAEHSYHFPNQEIHQWDRYLPVPTGAWRGLSASVNAFAIEVSMDQLAKLAKVDPVQFRLNHLDKKNSRLAAVVSEVAKMSRWGTGLPDGYGRGIACGIYKEVSFVAVVADVKVDYDNKTIEVKKLYCAHDCGLIINPNSIESAIEGNLVWGVGMALHEDVNIQDGQINVSNFHDMKIPRIKDTPEIEIQLIEDKSIPPGGAGEPAIMPTPAAIANAVSNATGRRVSQLPIRIDELEEESVAETHSSLKFEEV